MSTKWGLWAFVALAALRAEAADFPAPGEFTLAPPPRPGTAAYRKDFEVLHRWQQTRDEKACALGRSQKIPTPRSFFAYSGHLTADEFRRAEPALKDAFKRAEKVTHHYKTKYGRPRPFNTDPKIVPCVDKPSGNRAYPSSHAALAAVGGCVLAKLYPTKARGIVEYAQYLGTLRVIVGVHHPSDVAAGHSLARQICERLP